MSAGKSGRGRAGLLPYHMAIIIALIQVNSNVIFVHCQIAGFCRNPRPLINHPPYFAFQSRLQYGLIDEPPAFKGSLINT
jgi:hypothetical protein